MDQEETQPNSQQANKLIPPKPPDKMSICNNTESYKSKLLATEQVISLHVEECLASDSSNDTNDIEVLDNGMKIISLSKEETDRLCSPWKHSLIIKLLGKKVTYQYLRDKLISLWQLDESFPLIDLGLDFYTVKLTHVESVSKILQNGPWFINGHYLSIKRWEPNFVPEKEKVTYSAVWVRLPQLPTEFYDSQLLKKIGNAIGKLLKIDACTSSALRGRYARLCVQIPMEEPVVSSIQIGSHMQHILYEG
ncbi:hypothetical protein BC332_09700 [Capsicum chinense]|nr:hypothetical protein BC332_09700 [Capsicum chinense]